MREMELGIDPERSGGTRRGEPAQGGETAKSHLWLPSSLDLKQPSSIPRRLLCS